MFAQPRKNVVLSQSLKAFCDKYHPDAAVRISAMKYINQGWMENIPLYAYVIYDRKDNNFD